MNPLTVARTAMAILADKVPDPNDVKPGWIGFVVIITLMVAVVVLLLSFRKQLRKVDGHFGAAEGKGPAGAGNGSAENGGAASS